MVWKLISVGKSVKLFIPLNGNEKQKLKTGMLNVIILWLKFKFHNIYLEMDSLILGNDKNK